MKNTPVLILFTSIILYLIYSPHVNAIDPEPNSPPMITQPANGQTFTFREEQGLDASIIVEARDGDATDIVNIMNSPLPPYAYWEFLETHQQPSSGRVTWEDRGPVEGRYDVTFTASDEHGATSPPVKVTIVIEPSQSQLDISAAMKQKRVVTLLAIKNDDEAPIYNLEIRRSTDGNLSSAKARGWQANIVSTNTALLETPDRRIIKGQTVVMLIVLDGKPSWLSWAAMDADRKLLSSDVFFPMV